MVQFHVITIFPEIFESFLATSLMGRALQGGLLQISFTDPRDFTNDRHRSVDDTPYGGGEGMVMKPEPLVAALESLPAGTHRILLSPQGQPLQQPHLEQIAARPRVALVCGRYEGVDERVREHVDQELSLGDFVLQGGEVAAMAVMEGAARLVPGVLGNPGSVADESHAAGLLEYPQYTRPREFRGREVPQVLLDGNHGEIRRWRRQQMLQRTRARRPDLWQRFAPTAGDRPLLGDEGQKLAQRTHVALLHHPVLDRTGEVVTTAVTNLDIHDIARSACTYGLAGYHVVTPLTSQRELVRRIVEHWRSGHGALVNRRRREALELLSVAPSLQELLAQVAERHGQRPLTVATTAGDREGQLTRRQVLDRLGPEQPLLLLMGTGWGLTDEALAAADLCLAPIRGPVPYNHLSVRSAVAIVLDRFLGIRH
jgi:tRNA (guanine37-N1)-methyltransferase